MKLWKNCDDLFCTVLLMVILSFGINCLFHTNNNNQNLEHFSGNTTFYFFNMDGCPHCDNMKPEWEKLENSDFVSENAENLELKSVNAKDSETTKEYGVSGYPSLILDRNGSRIEYKGDRTSDDMVMFLQKNI